MTAKYTAFPEISRLAERFKDQLIPKIMPTLTRHYFLQLVVLLGKTNYFNSLLSGKNKELESFMQN